MRRSLHQDFVRSLALVAVIGALAPLMAQSQAGDPHNIFRVQSKQPLRLSLEEVIKLAVENNLDIAAASFDPLISETIEDSELAAFDPLYFANFNTNESVLPTASSLAGAAQLQQRQHHLDTGIRKRTIAGGSYEVRLDVDRNKTNSTFSQLNPTYASDAVIAANQPLLRGAGARRNLADLKQAQNATMAAHEAEAGMIATTVAVVARSYWALVFAIGDLDVKRISLKRANKLLDENRQRFEVGSITELDVISAQVDVAQREEDLVVAEQRVKDTEDRLKFQIQPLSPEIFEQFDIVPTTTPRTAVPELDYLDLARTALAQRWNLAQSRLELANRDIRIKTAEHDLLPILDIEGSYSVNAMAGHLDPSLGALDDDDFYTWSGGLSFEAPFGNRSAEANLRRNQLELRQALVRHRAAEELVIVEVRVTLRAVTALEERLSLAHQATELAARQLEKEEARYREGLSTAFQVLDFQEDLATAESSELQARVSLEQSLIDLLLSSGRILDEFRIVQVEPAR